MVLLWLYTAEIYLRGASVVRMKGVSKMVYLLSCQEEEVKTADI